MSDPSHNPYSSPPKPTEFDVSPQKPMWQGEPMPPLGDRSGMVTGMGIAGLICGVVGFFGLFCCAIFGLFPLVGIGLSLASLLIANAELKLDAAMFPLYVSKIRTGRTLAIAGLSVCGVILALGALMTIGFIVLQIILAANAK